LERPVLGSGTTGCPWARMCPVNEPEFSAFMGTGDGWPP
jgi:hypothetical protein